ncbi:hypothetical protein HG531_009266 [Fusarium graminearum]|nr:hypothetical protein HG531_009266 [Fusarium graminearum]
MLWLRASSSIRTVSHNILDPFSAENKISHDWAVGVGGSALECFRRRRLIDTDIVSLIANVIRGGGIRANCLNRSGIHLCDNHDSIRLTVLNANSFDPGASIRVLFPVLGTSWAFI